MTRRLVTMGPDAPIAEIVDKLIGSGLSGLPVVDADRCLLGVVTEADLLAKVAYGGLSHRPLALVASYLAGRDPRWVRKAAGLTAREVMTAPVTTAAPSHDVRDVARRMLEFGVKRVPVIEHGRLVGIVSRRDLLAALVTG